MPRVFVNTVASVPAQKIGAWGLISFVERELRLIEILQPFAKVVARN
jgi:hypothetical protein